MIQVQSKGQGQLILKAHIKIFQNLKVLLRIRICTDVEFVVWLHHLTKPPQPSESQHHVAAVEVWLVAH